MELQMLVQPRAEPWRRRSRRASQGLDSIHVYFAGAKRKREKVSVWARRTNNRSRPWLFLGLTMYGVQGRCSME